MRRLAARLRNLFGHDRVDAELAREMSSHLALLEEEHSRRGLSPDEARLAARRAMGSVALARDRHRDARSFGWIDDARHDCRFAIRMLAHNPGFAFVVILTMALSIGATSTLFSVAYVGAAFRRPITGRLKPAPTSDHR